MSDFKRLRVVSGNKGGGFNQKFNYVNCDVERMEQWGERWAGARRGAGRITNVAWKIIHISIQRKYCITGVLMPRREKDMPVT